MFISVLVFVFFVFVRIVVGFVLFAIGINVPVVSFLTEGSPPCLAIIGFKYEFPLSCPITDPAGQFGPQDVAIAISNFVVAAYNKILMMVMNTAIFVIFVAVDCFVVTVTAIRCFGGLGRTLLVLIQLLIQTKNIVDIIGGVTATNFQDLADPIVAD